MSEQDRYIPGVPCWVDTTHPDPEAAAAFYAGLFGWELEDSMPPDQGGNYFTATLEGKDVAAIASVPEGAPEMATWNTYIWVESADESAAKAKAAGGRVVTEPFDVFDAGRMAVIADPEGAILMLWEPKAHRGAQLVNASGSLVFNGLNTRDPDRAAAFYGELFGWVPMGEGAGGMWRLPGYGDFLESRSPGMREQMEEAGAPEGFVDVVAALAPIPDDQPDTPAHWNVTFAVDDADATAERAAELGGEVMVPPMDAPWVRMTVIRDPQGASFIASNYVPENKDLGS